ncbi:hypothetical protein ACIQUQ_26150 [Streptomyces sp. NPDC101118]|uniref:hypothetical protein n=1 Tax=Streptomyces sp. NPDC101118 TaxID=3366109 RepID=UPI0037FEF5CE
MSRFFAAALVALAAVALTGCSHSGDRGERAVPEPELGTVAVNPATASIALPLDAYQDSAEENRRMDAVQDRLIARCMARFGFTYQPPVATRAPTAGGAADRHQYLFGLADPRYAAIHGYDKDAGRPEPPKPRAPRLGDSAHTVMYGERPGGRGQTGPDPRTQEEAERADSGLAVGGQRVPPGGCQRESYRRLYAPAKESVDLLYAFGLTSEAHTRAQQDSRVRAVLAKWSACMGRAGYPGIGSPYEVTQKLGLAADRGGPRAVRAAVADVACKREVNLVGVWAAAEAAYQRRLVEEHAETLALYKRQREERFRLAATLS